MVMGRPVEWNKEAVADALIEWAKKDDSINLNAFCSSHDPLIPPQYITRWSNENEYFCEAYNIAKTFLAARRERKLNENKLHVKAFDMNSSVYDYFLREERRKEKEFEASLKNKDNEEKISQLEKILEYMKTTDDLTAEYTKALDNLNQES